MKINVTAKDGKMEIIDTETGANLTKHCSSFKLTNEFPKGIEVELTLQFWRDDIEGFIDTQVFRSEPHRIGI